MADTQLQQLIINVGTTAQIEDGIQQGTITNDMLSISTDDSTYQLTANLVTSISSNSTNTQYPSAKCVYDIVGDIETLLQGLR